MSDIVRLIVEALRKLDPANPENWTQDGLPKLAAVQGLVGDTSITRKDVEESAPGLTRETFGAFFSDEEAPGPAPGDEAREPDLETLRAEALASDGEVADLEARLEQARRIRAEKHAKLAQETPQASLADCNRQFRESLKARRER